MVSLNLTNENFMRKLQQPIAALVFLTFLAACGNSQGDRVLSGAGIGAGAVGDALIGGSPVTGALLGGAVGAAAGGLTKKKDVDLGTPIWR